MRTRLLRMIERERWSRRDIETAIDTLIDRLDDLEPDTDIELDEDFEPPLGWSGTYAIGRFDGRPGADECEGEMAAA